MKSTDFIFSVVLHSFCHSFGLLQHNKGAHRIAAMQREGNVTYHSRKGHLLGDQIMAGTWGEVD